MGEDVSLTESNRSREAAVSVGSRFLLSDSEKSTGVEEGSEISISPSVEAEGGGGFLQNTILRLDVREENSALFWALFDHVVGRPAMITCYGLSCIFKKDLWTLCN